MALHFVTPDATGASVGSVVSLTGPEARHAAVVRRVRLGELNYFDNPDFGVLALVTAAR